jgi:S1-C subfamily serine protease
MKKVFVKIARIMLISIILVIFGFTMFTILSVNKKVSYSIQEFNNKLREYIDLQPSRLQQEKRKIEENLINSTYLIKNNTTESQGSGVLIKYNNNFYILSAAHIVGDNNINEISILNNIELFENNILIGTLSVKKINRDYDIVLFSIDNIKSLNIKNYATIADSEPGKAENIYIVGNPVGVEDLLSEGKVITHSKYFAYFYDHSYFGSSGGGIFNQKGELAGTISHMRVSILMDIPFIIHGATRQSIMVEFLKDIK